MFINSIRANLLENLELRIFHFQTNLDFGINSLNSTLTSLSCWEIIFRINSHQLYIMCQVFY